MRLAPPLALLLMLAPAPALAARGGFVFDIGADVPFRQESIIREGLEIAEDYIEKVLGGAMPPAFQARVIVKIEATGRGNQEPGGGGGVATALSQQDPNVPRLYFDVAHEQWDQNSQGRGWSTRTDNLKTVVHEYTHGWQNWLGALTIYSQPLGNWMNEGLAEFVAYSALADAGKLSKADADRFVLNGARGAETDEALQVFGTTQSPAWAGHVGYLAIDWLVIESPNGMLSLRILAEQVGSGQSAEQAFAKAFNIELDSFYEQFEVWRQIILNDPVNALKRRPALVMTGE